MFVEAGGAATNIDIIPFAGCPLSMDGDRDTSSCESPKSAFQLSMREVLRACGSISKFNARVLDILRNGDFYHQETQLVDKCNQGKKAAKAFDFQRRLPALIGGGLCILVGACARSYVFRCCSFKHFLSALSVGFALMLTSMAFGAPAFYDTLGLGIGIVPGLTVAALAVLSDDHLTIERLMRAMCGAGILFGLLNLSRALPIIKPFFDNSRACIDSLYIDAPCWVSAAQVGLYVFNVLLIFKVVVNRFYVGLYTTRAGRHDLCWQAWASYLGGSFTIRGLFLLLPWWFYPEGRVFLLSLHGGLGVLVTVEMACLSKFCATKSWYTGGANVARSSGNCV